MIAYIVLYLTFKLYNFFQKYIHAPYFDILVVYENEEHVQVLYMTLT